LKSAAAMLCAVVTGLAATTAGVAMVSVSPYADAAQPIPGYLDPRTGTFTALPQSPVAGPEASAANPTVLEGTLDLTVTVNIDATSCARQTVTAYVDVEVSDNTYSGSISAPPYPPRKITCSKGKGTLKLSWPFAFAVAGTSATMQVTVDIFAGAAPNTLYSSLTATLPPPKNGINKISLPEGI
jgi:hypothetical protein